MAPDFWGGDTDQGEPSSHILGALAGCGALQSGRPHSSLSGVLITHSFILQLQLSPDHLPLSQLPAIHISKSSLLLCPVPLGLLCHRSLSWAFSCLPVYSHILSAWLLSCCLGADVELCWSPCALTLCGQLGLELWLSLAATANIFHICSLWGHSYGACLVSSLQVASIAHSQPQPGQALPCLLTTWWGPCSACLVVSHILYHHYATRPPSFCSLCVCDP